MIKPLFVVAAALLAAPAIAQEPAAPMAADAPMAGTALPKCTAKVQDRCDQSMTTEKRAMTGEQADARDARHGGMWTPDGAAGKAAKKAPAPM